MSGVLIRRAESNDLHGIFRCISQMASYKPSVEQHQLIAERFFSQDWVHAVVAVHRGSHFPDQVIGFASISFEMKIRGGVIGHVEDVVVDGRWRRRGVGKALLDALQEESLRRNAYRIYLECSESSSDFYVSCGFVRSGLSMSRNLN